MVGRTSRWSGSGLETLPKVQAWTGGPPEDPGVLGDPLGGPGVVWRPSRRSRSGLETLPKVQAWTGGPPEDPGVLGDPPGGPGVVWRPFRRVRMPSQSSGSGREALSMVWEWSSGHIVG